MSEQIIVDARADIEEGALSEAHARDLVEQIRLSTGRLLEAMADIEVLVSTAYHGRAWLSLGYESWEELVGEELTEARLWTSVEERDQRMRALSEAGLTLRPIAAVMGVSKNTVHRAIASSAGDLATVPNGTVASPPASSRSTTAPSGAQVSAAGGQERSGTGSVPVSRPVPAKSIGLDGRERSRATSEQRVERAVKAYQLHSEGMKTPEIGRELGVSQRQAWSDVNDMGSWTERLSEADRERLSAGQMKGREFAQKADLEVASEGPKLQSSAEAGRRALRDAVNFLHTNVIMADAWLQEGKDLSPGMAETTTATTLQISHWLAEDLEWTDLNAEECTRALGNLQQAMQYLEQATSELTGLVTQ